MKRTKKQNRPMNKVNNQPQPINEKEEVKTLRISELHLAKLHEMTKKGMQVAQASNDIYQREFALKDAIKKLEELKKSKEELDAFNTEFLREDNIIRDEIMQEYGDIKLNLQTGEYTLAN